MHLDHLLFIVLTVSCIVFYCNLMLVYNVINEFDIRELMGQIKTEIRWEQSHLSKINIPSHLLSAMLLLVVLLIFIYSNSMLGALLSFTLYVNYCGIAVIKEVLLIEELNELRVTYNRLRCLDTLFAKRCLSQISFGYQKLIDYKTFSFIYLIFFNIVVGSIIFLKYFA